MPDSPYRLPVITDEMAEQLMPGIGRMALERLAELEMTKAQYLEKMAAAFVLETGIPATECELVQEQLPHPQIGWRLYIRRRP